MGVNDLAPDLRHYGFDPDDERKGVRRMKRKPGMFRDWWSAMMAFGGIVLFSVVLCGALTVVVLLAAYGLGWL
jgi:hypothetical protein